MQVMGQTGSLSGLENANHSEDYPRPKDRNDGNTIRSRTNEGYKMLAWVQPPRSDLEVRGLAPVDPCRRRILHQIKDDRTSRCNPAIDR